MKLLYVHERFGALAGAEANAHITATELAARGHVIGIIHGPGTGKNETAWQTTFSQRFALGAGDNAAVVRAAHSLAGSGSIFGLNELRRLGLELEDCAGLGDPAVGEALIARLNRHYLACRPVLERLRAAVSPATPI